MSALAPVLEQLAQALTGLTEALGQSGAVAGATGGAAAAPSGAPISGGGPTSPAGCGCGAPAGALEGAGQYASQATSAGGAAGSPVPHASHEPASTTDDTKVANQAPKPDIAQATKPDIAQAPVGVGGISSPGDLTVKKRRISQEQLANVNAVLTVGKKMGASDKVLQASVATMIQESSLRNLDFGDRDSLGLFQQRPSQGWGTPAQVRDPEHAAKKFFERAIKHDRVHPKYSIAQLSQAVQISAFPDAYAQWEQEGGKIVAAFNAGT